jgi:recombination protein RecT
MTKVQEKPNTEKPAGVKKAELAQAKNEILESTERRISELVDTGMLHLPPNYSAANALRAAWLILQETVDKNRRPVLEACTRSSIANALLSMCIQGLDPNRNQCYFIAHGPQLTLRRSYFGTLALAKRLAKVKDAYAETIYEGDEFEFETERGRKRIVRHKQSLQSIAAGKLVGAYCVVEFEDGRDVAEVMPMSEIQKAWAKGGGDNPARKEFPGEMAKRTVMNRALKRHINSSDDSHLGLVLTHVNRTDAEAAAEEIEAEALEAANKETLSLPEDRTIDVNGSSADSLSGAEAGEVAGGEPSAAGSGQLFDGAGDAPY